MKKALLLLVCTVTVILQGAVLGEYVFKSKTAQDISPAGKHPLSMPEAAAFTDDAVDMSVSEGIKLPVAAFPGANGTMEAEIQLKEKAGFRMFFIYYGGGDVLNIICSNTRFQCRFFSRSENKWQSSKFTKAIPLGQFVKLSMVWNTPGKITLTVDGSSVELPVAKAANFVPRSSVMMLGSNQRGEWQFPGLVKSFKLTDGK